MTYSEICLFIVRTVKHVQIWTPYSLEHISHEADGHRPPAGRGPRGEKHRKAFFFKGNMRALQTASHQL